MGSGLDAGMTGGAVAIRALPSRAHPLPPPPPGCGTKMLCVAAATYRVAR